jgi:hypothetical protein
MLEGDREQTSTKRPKVCLSWQMVWWVKGLMNHSILKAANNVGLLRTHTGGETIVKLNEIHADQNIPQLLGNAVRKGKASKREPRHGGQALQSRHRHQRHEENLQQATQGLPPLANGLLGEGLNEAPNSMGCNQCGIIFHKHKGERQY